MSPLVKQLCKIRNKQISRGANTELQERINKLIRDNQIRAVSNENKKYKQGAKGWWNTVNKITGRSIKSHNICSSISDAVRSIIGGGQIFIYSCSQTVKTIDFKI